MSKNKQEQNNKANQNNPNNKAHKANVDNRSNQKNPNNDATKSNNVATHNNDTTSKRKFKTIFLEYNKSQIIDMDLLKKVEVKIEYVKVKKDEYSNEPEQANAVNIIISFYLPNNVINTKFQLLYSYGNGYLDERKRNELQYLLKNGIDIRGIIYENFGNYICEFLCNDGQKELYLDYNSIKPYQNTIQAINENVLAKKVNINSKKYMLIYSANKLEILDRKYFSINSISSNAECLHIYDYHDRIETRFSAIEISLNGIGDDGEVVFYCSKQINSPLYTEYPFRNKYQTQFNLLDNFNVNPCKTARNKLNGYSLKFLNGEITNIDILLVANEISSELSNKAQEVEEEAKKVR